MTNLSLSPRSVFNLSETLVIIPRHLRCTGSICAHTLYEQVHIDVLRYIAEPTQQTLCVAIESIDYAAKSIRTYRDYLNAGDQYSAAHNAVFKYFILKRELELAQKVNDLETTDDAVTALHDKYVKACAELEEWKDNFEAVSIASSRRLSEKIELQKEIDRLREENEALIEKNPT